ncbi:hypothetical protein [Rhodoblastus sp.]
MVYTIDSRKKVPAKPVRDTGIVQKKLVATFSGTAYAAERDGDELHVYLMTSDPVPTGAAMDRAKVADAQIKIRAHEATMTAFAERLKAQSAKLWGKK